MRFLIYYIIFIPVAVLFWIFLSLGFLGMLCSGLADYLDEEMEKLYPEAKREKENNPVLF